MHFHLPKPLHGWRAFVGEVGIIVVGVLIALGAEQVVETIHYRTELRDAEGAMIAELRDDNLPQAFTRAAVYNCYSNQLDSIERAVASGDRPKVLELARAYRPVPRTYDDQAWQAAVASQVLVHSGAQRMLAWATAYRLVPIMGARATVEQDELGQLYARLGGSGPLTTAQQDRLFQVVSTLRGQNRSMAGTSLVFIKYLARQKLTLSKRQQDAILRDARQLYGTCVVEPAPERVNVTSQLIIPNNELQGRK